MPYMNTIKVFRDTYSKSGHKEMLEMLWHDLKQFVHPQKAYSVAELKQLYKDELAKSTPHQCEWLIASYHGSLIAVVAAEGGTSSY